MNSYNLLIMNNVIILYQKLFQDFKANENNNSYEYKVIWRKKLTKKKYNILKS